MRTNVAQRARAVANKRNLKVIKILLHIFFFGPTKTQEHPQPMWIHLGQDYWWGVWGGVLSKSRGEKHKFKEKHAGDCSTFPVDV